MTEGKESIKDYNSQPPLYFLRAGLFLALADDVLWYGSGPPLFIPLKRLAEVEIRAWLMMSHTHTPLRPNFSRKP